MIVNDDFFSFPGRLSIICQNAFFALAGMANIFPTPPNAFQERKNVSSIKQENIWCSCCMVIFLGLGTGGESYSFTE